jgi:hypothetical protein
MANGTKVRMMFVATDSAQGAATGSLVEAAVDDIEILELSWATNVNDVQGFQSALYPNPANNEVSIVSAFNGNMRYIVRNAMGQVLVDDKQTSVAGQPIRVSTRNLAAGVYFVELQMDGQKSTHKLVVQHN